jgi:hypothetical protein
MKTFLLSVVGLVAFTVTAHCEGERGQWLLADRTDPSQTRHANVWLAAKITIEGDRVTLFTVKDGRILPYFESNDPAAANNMRMQIGYNNPQSVQMDDGSVVRLDFVTSCSIKTEAGKESATLAAYTCELGTVSDAKQINKVKSQFGIPVQQSR